MDSKAMDDISLRYILPLSKEDVDHPERLFFILEEAHWFYIDLIDPKSNISFKFFSQLILQHNQIKFCEKDFRDFFKYRKNVPVYGALIMNEHFDKILLVRGYTQQCFFFPKGKKNRDEAPVECAVREVFEEIGYDIEDKILDMEINIGKRFVIFPVINVNEEYEFVTRTRNEIEEIKWVKIDDILFGNDPKLYNVQNYLNSYKYVLDDFKKNRFRFDLTKFEEIFK